MSNCYAGKDGALSVDGTNIASLTSWSVSQSAEVLECQAMGGDGWKDNKPGMKSWEGSAEANFTDDTVTPGAAANAVSVGSEVALVFYPDTGTTLSFTGNAVITSIENSAALGSIQTVSLSFTGSGPLATDLTA